MRAPLPAQEVDVLAYISYLSLEVFISADSLPRYVSAVSGYHELHHLPSQTRTHLARALQQAYHRVYDETSPAKATRVGCPASLIRRIVQFGLTNHNNAARH